MVLYSPSLEICEVRFRAKLAGIDLEELIHLISEDPGNSAVRCSKVRKMFAMRACRKSVMVGRALTEKGMERLVKHMVSHSAPS